MASLSARSKPKITTYGRTNKKATTFARPSQQTAKNNHTDLSRPVSDAPAATRQDEYDPYSFPADDTSPEPPALISKAKVAPPAQKSRTQANGERKRKIAHVYPAKDQVQDPLSEDSPPVAPRPKQRSRVPSPTDNVAGRRGKTYGATRPMRPASTDMDVDAADGILSSPPPTPTPPKDTGDPFIEAPNRELPFSPNTMQTLGNLHVGDTPSRHQQIPVRPKHKPSTHKQSTGGPAIPRDVSRLSKQPAASDPAPAPAPAKKPRRKLIDALVEQMEESDDPADEENTGSRVGWTEPVASSSQLSESQDSQSPSQPSRTRKTYGATGPRTLARSGSSLKHTYGQRVTLLEEDNIFDALALPVETSSSGRRRLELTPSKLPHSSQDPEDDPSATASARKIRGIHELKQAGANSRVADEMMDLSSDIGQPSAKPSSSRRAALLQIADKARHKDFRQHIRDHGLDAMILSKIGDETDPISGYLISAILLQVLASSTAPHIIQLLQNEGAGNFFGRLLQLDEDMKRLVRDRKSNLMKRHQGSLLAVETALLELPIWQPLKPTSTSPRTVALKCLAMLVAQDAHLGSDDALFEPSVTKGLFDALSAARDSEFWEQPDTEDMLNVRCSLSVLEYHAVKAMEAQNREQLATEYLPSVADAFGGALQDPTRHTDLQSLLLKLVLNMTNSSVTAPDIFVAKGLLLPLSSSICDSFTQSLSAVAGGEEWTEGLFEGLVLRLGILINFAEQSMAVREAVYESRSSSGVSPTQELIRLFLANHRATAEADSEAKSQLNVAFGYLSVLLGYLCLYAPIRKTFRSSHSAKSMGPLLDSIQEFISHHRAMEASLLDAGVDDPRSHGGYTERLQGLVDQLEVAYD